MKPFAKDEHRTHGGVAFYGYHISDGKEPTEDFVKLLRAAREQSRKAADHSDENFISPASGSISSAGDYACATLSRLANHAIDGQRDHVLRQVDAIAFMLVECISRFGADGYPAVRDRLLVKLNTLQSSLEWLARGNDRSQMTLRSTMSALVLLQDVLNGPEPATRIHHRSGRYPTMESSPQPMGNGREHMSCAVLSPAKRNPAKLNQGFRPHGEESVSSV
jgi:hypothetical protein